MLAFCSSLLPFYYSNNFAGKIYASLLIYNSGDQNVLINDWYVCLQVFSKQLYVWNAYLSLLGFNLVIAGL